MNDHASITIEEGSTNVYAALGPAAGSVGERPLRQDGDAKPRVAG